MTKRLSKRISTRKRQKMLKKARRDEKETRMEEVARRKRFTKIPRSVLMTDEEKRQHSEIRDRAARRSQEYQKPVDVPVFVQKIGSCLEGERPCDAFVEVVDFRDIEGSRCRRLENIVLECGRSVLVFVNYGSDAFEANLDSLRADGLEILSDHRVLSDCKRICFFGNAKSGKFLLSKSIEKTNGSFESVFIRTPVESSTSAEVFRKNVGLSDINAHIMIQEVLRFIDPSELRDFYRLPDFADHSAFLEMLSKTLVSGGEWQAKNPAALQFYRDVLDGKILWMKHQNQYRFRFSTQAH